MGVVVIAYTVVWMAGRPCVGPFGPTHGRRARFALRCQSELNSLSSKNFGCFLSTHPSNNTETDLVDDVCNVVSTQP